MDIYNFYNKFGWKKNNKINSFDAELFEDLRKTSADYVSKCRHRINNFIPKKGVNILDFASGPIQYKEYLNYSKNFKKRHCVDFSKIAIKEAKKKIGKKGKFYCKDFLKIKFRKNYFDTIISLHTIYHVKKNKQKDVINKLIDITKKGQPIIIVYSNPNTFLSRFKKYFKKTYSKQKIYFYCHPLNWWFQFEKKAQIKFYPWRSFSSQHQKIFFPGNIIGKMMLHILFSFEKKFPNFFVRNFQYPIIVLRKK